MLLSFFEHVFVLLYVFDLLYVLFQFYGILHGKFCCYKPVFILSPRFVHSLCITQISFLSHLFCFRSIFLYCNRVKFPVRCAIILGPKQRCLFSLCFRSGKYNVGATRGNGISLFMAQKCHSYNLGSICTLW